MKYKGETDLNTEMVERVARKYLDSLYRLAITYCRNSEDAEDAIQNAFLKLMKTDTEFSDDEHIHRWLCKVTINECKTIWRLFNRHPVISLEEYMEDNDLELNTVADISPDTCREIRDAVMNLPTKYRVVLYLYYYEGYSAEEISQMVGISQSNVQIRLMRGRNKLKELLGGSSL